MRPTTAHIDVHFDNFLHPGTRYDHPRDVVRDRSSASRKSELCSGPWRLTLLPSPHVHPCALRQA
jgi:hypothetical protein